MFGSHPIKHWSSMQASIAFGSRKAEFAGELEGAGQGLGFQSILKDLGVLVLLRVWTDSTAAIGICSRQGLGKLCHLDALWIQQEVRTGRVDLRKIRWKPRRSCYEAQSELQPLVNLFCCEFLGGHAESALQLRNEGSSKITMADAPSDLGHVKEEHACFWSHQQNSS